MFFSPSLYRGSPETKCTSVFGTFVLFDVIFTEIESEAHHTGCVYQNILGNSCSVQASLTSEVDGDWARCLSIWAQANNLLHSLV